MSNHNVSEQRVTRICRYFIASADMYYSAMEERDVCMCDDPVKGFRIWGEIPGKDVNTAVDLCEIFLEYAMYCRTWSNPSEALYNMNGFGERLGEALARHLIESAPAVIAANPAACALECVLESMNVNFTVEQIGSELRYIVTDCPLQETAQRTGLREVELAQHGINALCQRLIEVTDTNLVVRVPSKADADYVFSVMTPVLS